ncbi:glycoside hydrolase family 16 protein [Jiangella asiatica]|uniref:GH16 domain-containing protein n=1 Tax=Jiangella asiatica TaxID=2530372 RepID=A0A4R5DD24_9ACTN|nr:hypothetical protein [Jiangella asiatica]TDE09890.1 hypothetical protein E1269_13015 [Jiangella asiatica]
MNADQTPPSRRTSRRRFLQTAGAGLVLAGTPSLARATESQVVFFDDFTSAATIDVGATDAPGYNWYPRKWFRTTATRPENISVSDSVLTLGGNGGESDLTRLSTAIAVDTSPYARGTVFHGGYFEARIAFDHAERPPTAGANPAFWSMAIEHVAHQYVGTFYTQWPGQAAGYSHYIELDFMEHFSDPRQSYVCTVHDWSGPYATPPGSDDDPFWWYDIANGNNIVQVGPVDWSEFHTYSCYWAPQNGSTPGHVQWFFDGLAGPTTNVYWAGPIGAPPLPGQAPEPGTPAHTSFTPDTPAEADRTFAILDQQRIALTLTTDPGFPMYVDWVRVSDSTVEVL